MYRRRKILQLLLEIFGLIISCLSKSNAGILFRNLNNRNPIEQTTKNAVLRAVERGDGLIGNSNNLRIPRWRPYSIKDAENTRRI